MFRTKPVTAIPARALRPRYAIPGTDLAHAATRLHVGGACENQETVPHPLWSYALTTESPVLTDY
eukprot:110117-Rhodomonas_salina.1